MSRDIGTRINREADAAFNAADTAARFRKSVEEARTSKDKLPTDNLPEEMIALQEAGLQVRVEYPTISLHVDCASYAIPQDITDLALGVAANLSGHIDEELIEKARKMNREANHPAVRELFEKRGKIVTDPDQANYSKGTLRMDVTEVEVRRQAHELLNAMNGKGPRPDLRPIILNDVGKIGAYAVDQITNLIGHGMPESIHMPLEPVQKVIFSSQKQGSLRSLKSDYIPLPELQRRHARMTMSVADHASLRESNRRRKNTGIHPDNK